MIKEWFKGIFEKIKIKFKENRENEKLRKEALAKLTYNEINKEIEEKQERISELNEELSKRDKDCNFGLDFAYFGLIVFIVAILFFGSMDGAYFIREDYVNIIQNASNSIEKGLNYSSQIISNSVNYLFIKLYDLGSSKPRLFFWLWWITLIWWIGYMFLFKMFKTSFLTIRDLFYPMIKNFIKRKKSI